MQRAGRGTPPRLIDRAINQLSGLRRLPAHPVTETALLLWEMREVLWPERTKGRKQVR